MDIVNRGMGAKDGGLILCSNAPGLRIFAELKSEPWATQQKQAGNDLDESFKNAVDMGFNGTWIFTFKSPFYLWLLENLY